MNLVPLVYAGVLVTSATLAVGASSAGAAAVEGASPASTQVYDFADGARGWETLGGTWTPADGQYLGRGEAAAESVFAFPRRAPLAATQTIEVVVTPRIGLRPERGADLPLRFYLAQNPYVSRR